MKDLGVKTFIYPQPVLILGTYDEDGTPNAMNAAWGGIYDYDAVTVSLSKHKTTENFERTKAFTIGIGDAENVIACDYVGLVSGKEVKDKVAKCGWTAVKSKNVNAPIFEQLPLTLECEVISFIEGTLVGRIVNVVAREDILGEDGLPDMSKFNPICYEPAHHTYRKMGEVVGHAFKDGKKIK